MYGTYSVNSYARSAQNMAIFGIIAVLVALVAAIVIYFVFLSKKNELRFSGFLGWLYDFLSFKKLMVEGLLKVFYLFAAILMVFIGFMMMPQTFFGGLLTMIFGNILLRILYEFIMIQILICKNTADICKNTAVIASGKSNDPKNGTATPQPKAPQNPFEPSPIPKPPVPGPATPGSMGFQSKINICKACGNKIKPDAKFCPFCGTKKDY